VAIAVVAMFSFLVLLPDGVERDGIGTFRIPTLSIINTTATSATAIPLGEIFCTVKQETIVYSSTGSVIQTLESNTVQGTPFTSLQFTFDPETMEQVSHFVITPKVFCTQENSIPIQVTFPRSIAFSVNLQSCSLDSASGQRGDFACTGNNAIFGAGVRSGVYSFGSGQPETDMTHYVVKIADIEKTIGDVDLSARLQFTVSGDMTIAYKDSSGCPDCSQFTYDFFIPPRTLQTFYQAIILKAPVAIIDSDNDGIRDSFDDCPLEPETYNGFEDSDGCPDVRPPDLSPTTTTIVDETTPPAILGTALTCADTALGVFFFSNQQICVNQCSEASLDRAEWIDEIGVRTNSFGFDWNNGRCTIEDAPVEVIGMTISIVEEEPTIFESFTQPLGDLFDTLSEPTVADVSLEQITETIVEPTVEPTVTQEEPQAEPEPEFDFIGERSITEIPPPLFETTQQPIQEPIDTGQAQLQTITSGVPTEEGDITRNDIIILLIVGGVIGAIVIGVFASRRR